MVPPTCPAKKISGGQREEGHGVVHHVQWEHHQSYLLHHYKNASIQGGQIQRIRIPNTTIRSQLFEYSNSSNNSWKKCKLLHKDFVCPRDLELVPWTCFFQSSRLWSEGQQQWTPFLTGITLKEKWESVPKYFLWNQQNKSHQTFKY